MHSPMPVKMALSRASNSVLSPAAEPMSASKARLPTMSSAVRAKSVCTSTGAPPASRKIPPSSAALSLMIACDRCTNDVLSRPSSDALRARPQWKFPFAKATPWASGSPTMASDESRKNGSTAADRPVQPDRGAKSAWASAGSPTTTGVRGPKWATKAQASRSLATPSRYSCIFGGLKLRAWPTRGSRPGAVGIEEPSVDGAATARLFRRRAAARRRRAASAGGRSITKMQDLVEGLPTTWKAFLASLKC